MQIKKNKTNILEQAKNEKKKRGRGGGQGWRKIAKNLRIYT